MAKKNINEQHENHLAQFLIKEHTIGGLRDRADLDNAIYHSKKSLNLAKDLILNFSGTEEEKIAFVEKIIVDLDKFTVK